MSQPADVLRSRQLNPCDDLFWKSRGYTRRPENWQDLLREGGYYDDDTDSETSEDESEHQESSCEEEEEDDESNSEDEYDSEYEEHKENSVANNPNNDVFWQKRGYSCRPENWRELREQYGF